MSMTKHRISSIMSGAAVGAAVFAVTLSKANAQCVATADASQTQCQKLLAGQTIDAGDVCVTVADGMVNVTYVTENGWMLAEAHLWVGTNLADMPKTKTGNPKIGNFPYNSGDITGATAYTFEIPLESLGFVCPGPDQSYFAAAHAAVLKENGRGGYQTETGWAEGSKIVSRGSWATYFTFALTCACEDDDDGELTCETAFAYSETDSACFLDLDLDNNGSGDFNRWGWTIGPLQPGNYEFPIYAAAGQCDLSKGTLVGYLSVSYDGFGAHVGYNSIVPVVFEESHLYVGNDLLPLNNGQYTVAPGQYPYIHDLDGAAFDGYVISGLSGDIFVVAHAVACW